MRNPAVSLLLIQLGRCKPTEAELVGIIPILPGTKADCSPRSVYFLSVLWMVFIGWLFVVIVVLSLLLQLNKSTQWACIIVLLQLCRNAQLHGLMWKIFFNN